jgi:hypothetical protein
MLCRRARDPSLCLKNGCAQDDAIEIKIGRNSKLSHYLSSRSLPRRPSPHIL